CAVHTGIGADGVLELSRSDEPGFAARLRIFNPDGSEAELSGNGAREAVLYLREAGWTDADTFTILTKAGEVTPTITGPGAVSMAIGRASVTSPFYPEGPEDGSGTISSRGREWKFQHVDVGNPQCVIDAGDEIEELDLATLGPAIESSKRFPQRTNVSFTRADGSAVRARIFERGVGETLSSGTGASGAAVTAFLRGAPSQLVVELEGGELQVDIGEELAVRLDGWAEPVFAGELSPELLQALAELDGE
ncbi:MAG: diaminopimelate epimerase, partial [Solirubrobacterales bacterium]|nr:diaminopimelate epimerase [Solirubrobacterales bacterium]